MHWNNKKPNFREMFSFVFERFFYLKINKLIEFFEKSPNENFKCSNLWKKLNVGTVQETNIFFPNGHFLTY